MPTNYKRISKIENAPCIKQKCLKFPACRNKKAIYCNILNSYVDKQLLNYRFSTKSIWFKLSKIFPLVEFIEVAKQNNVEDDYE